MNKYAWKNLKCLANIEGVFADDNCAELVAAKWLDHVMVNNFLNLPKRNIVEITCLESQHLGIGLEMFKSE